MKNTSLQALMLAMAACAATEPDEGYGAGITFDDKGDGYAVEQDLNPVSI